MFSLNDTALALISIPVKSGSCQLWKVAIVYPLLAISHMLLTLCCFL